VNSVNVVIVLIMVRYLYYPWQIYDCQVESSIAKDFDS
jgi:hypothetical protein